MDDQVYRYRAFISYRHTERDRKWARWLMEKLETFRTPSDLVRSGIAPRIGHLYRDDDEIPASSDLSRQIEEALEASEFLIVVCSPDTPSSKWVSKEIEYFRSLGHGNHVLALLTEGEPAQSFPESLLVASDGITSTEPIAGDVRKRPDEWHSTTKHRALLRIAAGLLGARYDDFVKRAEKRRLIRRAAWVGVVVVALPTIATYYLSTLFAIGERESQAWVRHTDQVIERLEEVRSDLVQAEKSQREYLLTRREGHLDQYRSSIGRVRRDLAEFSMLTRDNPSEQMRAEKIEQQIEERVKDLDLEFALAGTRETAALQKSIIDGEKRDDAFDLVVAQGVGEELRLLGQRVTARRAAEQNEIFLVLVSLVLLLTVVAGVGVAASLRD